MSDNKIDQGVADIASSIGLVFSILLHYPVQLAFNVFVSFISLTCIILSLRLVIVSPLGGLVLFTIGCWVGMVAISSIKKLMGKIKNNEHILLRKTDDSK